MGTSGPYTGKGKRELLPPWADDVGGNGDRPSPGEPDSEGNNGRPTKPPQINSRALNQARNHISQYSTGATGHQSIGRSLNHYVRSRGGAAGATRASRVGRSTTARLGGFLSGVASQGVRTTLETWGLSNVVGRPIEEVLTTIVNAIAPSGATLEEAVARQAFNSTLAELYRRYDLADGGIENLDAMDGDGVRETLLLSISDQIFQTFLLEVQYGIEQGTINEHEAVDLEWEAKSFIRETVKLEMAELDMDVLHINWSSDEGERIIEGLYEQAHSILGGRE